MGKNLPGWLSETNWQCRTPIKEPKRDCRSSCRLGAKIVAEGARVDALIIWDMLCGTVARPCPKLVDPARATLLPSGLKVPPPCIYLFPRTKPDARNNPNPPAWRLEELPFIHALATTFRCKAEEIVQVRIQYS